MPLLGVGRVGDPVGIDGDVREFGLAAALSLAGGLLLGRAGVDLRLLPSRNGGGLVLQLGLAGAQPRQAVLAPR